MKIQNLIENQLNVGRKLLTESCHGLNEQQTLIVEGIYKDLEILIEASLAPDQIEKIFGAVEQEVTAGGDNRTLAGLGVDAAKQVDQTINNIGKWLQDTKPVQAFDQKFEQLKDKIAQKFPKVAGQVAKMGDWAKANPGKTAAIIGVLTAIAALGGGPVGGAIAGQILRGSAELLKGEKLSTAIGKGVKTAAYGFIAGKTFELIGDALGAGIEVVKDNLFPGAVKMNIGRTFTEIGTGGNRFADFRIKDLYGYETDVMPIRDLVNDAADAWIKGDYELSRTLWNQAKDAVAVMQSPEYLADVAANKEVRDIVATGAKAFASGADFLGAAAQGAAQASGMQKKESVYRQTRPLSEGQVYMMFNRLEVLTEGPLDWLKKKAHNVTTKVTADKLNSAWQKAGAPTDSEELRQFLAGQGIGDEVINKVYTDMKISSEPAASAEQPSAAMGYKEIKDMVLKLDKKGKQRIASYLQKQLGTA
jgi:hypothetical protein